jgi:predicted transcriptional regulator
MDPLNKDDLIDILETTTLAQLRALRAFRRSEHRKTSPSEPKRKSNMDIIYDLLLAAKGPLHINDIIQRAKENYHRQLHRESLVSALTKKVLDQNTFTRTAPNTFDLLKRPS